MLNPAITVIVPVYNAEEYLHKCINSILNQTFSGFELLLINDGSTDSSGKICDEYANTDIRIKVYHKENGGVSSARNVGINNSNGDFLIFVDSDDYIETKMLEDMYRNSQITKSDIVGCDFYQEYENLSIYTSAYFENRQEFLRAVIRNYWGVMWKILVKNDLYKKNNIQFPKNIDGGEDYFVCINLLFYANKVSCINKAYYHYNRINFNSIMAIQSKAKILHQVEATKMVEDFLINKGISQIYRKELNIRKFLAKQGLFKIDFNLWQKTFPESSGAWRYLNQSFKSKFVYQITEFGLYPFLSSIIKKIIK
jgi:glycosyltransferase involved in cell wall biosynthesis